MGALFLSIGAVLFLTLALQRFGPAARVTVGYVAAAGFLVSAAVLDRRHTRFARVLYGLGFSLLYIVTFATYYFPPARVFDSPLVTLLMLGAIIAVFIGIAQYRRSPTIAVVAILLGHTTIGVASFTLDDPGLYSGAGILVLTVGSAFFLLRDRWYGIAAVGMVGSYSNHFLLMINSTSNQLVSEFVVGISVLSGYYLIFALAELFAHEELRSKMPTWFRSAFVSFNTACYFGLGTLLVEAFEFTEDYHHIFRYGLAASLFLFALLYLRVRGRDPIYNAYFTKGTAALTLGFAAQFSGATLTTTLAVQMVVLLVSARFSGLVVTRLLALGVALLVFVHGGYVAVDAGMVSYDDPGYAARLIQYALTVLAYFAAALLYERTDWSARSPNPNRLSDATRDFLWDLDLVAEPSPRRAGTPKFLNGLLLPGVYVVSGTLLFLAFAAMLSEHGHRFGILGLAALTQIAVGRAARSQPLVACALLSVAAGLIFGTVESFDSGHTYARVLAGALPLLAAAFFTEPRIAGDHRALAALQAVATPYLLHGVPAWVLMLSFVQLHDPPSSLLFTAALAGYFAAIAFVATPHAAGVVAMALLLCAHAFWYPYSAQPDTAFHVCTWLLIASAIGGDRIFASRRLPAAGPIVVLSALAVAVRYTWVTVAPDWVGVAWAGVALAAAAYAGVLRIPAVAIGAAAVGVLASVQQLAIAYPAPPEPFPLVTGFFATAGLWVLAERTAARIDPEKLAPVRGICIAAATVLLLCLFERFQPLESVPLSARWIVLGFAIFAFAVAVGEKLYRYAGIAVVLFACLRVFADTSQLDAPQRIMSWIGVGAGMMILAFLYVRFFAETPEDAE